MRCFASVVVAAFLGCASTTSHHGHAEELPLLKASKIDVTDAIKAALAKAPGRVIDTEIHSKQGRTVWEVDVVAADGKVVEVDVDATSGQVLDSE
jgi:uncharacterized membrane protein YkoI